MKQRLYLIIVAMLGTAGLAWFGFTVASAYFRANAILGTDGTTYLPKLERVSRTVLDPIPRLLSRDWIEIGAPNENHFSLQSSSGDELISNISFFRETVKDGPVHYPVFDTLNATADGEGVAGVFQTACGPVDFGVQLCDETRSLRVTTVVKYTTAAEVEREALVIELVPEPSRMVKKNRRLAREPSKSEMWLDTQGAKFGESDSALLIYHTPGVSSLQYDPTTNMLVANLDWSKDHPHVHIPYQPDGGRRWIDQSTSIYSKGDTRTNRFEIHVGNRISWIPRIMAFPRGYTAAYVFTEHTCGSTLRTQRAVYFGCETIDNPKNATGGFVGHQLPTTKSVFYSNEEEAPSPGMFGGLEPSLVDDTEYLEFHDQLFETGLYEICLHTPSPLRSAEHQLLQESEHFMRERFNTQTWIDHGMSSGAANRESFISEGLVPDSEHYAADVWEEFGTNFFWNAAVEEMAPRREPLRTHVHNFDLMELLTEIWIRILSPGGLPGLFDGMESQIFAREINQHRPEFGAQTPTPIYWQHPTRTDDFYSWSTDYHFGHLTAEDWSRIHSDANLKQLIAQWGVFLNHCYPSASGRPGNTWIIEDDVIKIHPVFDGTLARMARYRDQGDLWVTTVADLLGYWIQLEQVSYAFPASGAVEITNNGPADVAGFTLALPKDVHATSEQVPVNFKKSGEDNLFWFDLPAEHSVVLNLSEQDFQTGE